MDVTALRGEGWQLVCPNRGTTLHGMCHGPGRWSAVDLPARSERRYGPAPNGTGGRTEWGRRPLEVLGTWSSIGRHDRCSSCHSRKVGHSRTMRTIAQITGLVIFLGAFL